MKTIGEFAELRGVKTFDIKNQGVYPINSYEPVRINKYSSSGYVWKNGFLEDYKFDDTIQNQMYWSRDEAGEEILTKEEVQALEYEDYESLFLHDHRDYCIRKYRYTPNDLYPHPWFPDREIVAFECLTFAPLWEVGKIYEVDKERIIRSELDWETSLWVSQALDYPEFFKPIYEDRESTTKSNS